MLQGQSVDTDSMKWKKALSIYYASDITDTDVLVLHLVLLLIHSAKYIYFVFCKRKSCLLYEDFML